MQIVNNGIESNNYAGTRRDWHPYVGGFRRGSIGSVMVIGGETGNTPRFRGGSRNCLFIRWLFHVRVKFNGHSGR